MKVLITGAAGFLGSHILNKLLSMGFNVLGLDNLSRPSDYGVKLLKNLGVKLYVMNVKNSEVINVLKNVDVVIHAAAYVDVAESVKEPTLYVDNNVLTTTYLAEVCVKKGVKRFIYVSSAAVYGEPKYLPIDEEHPLEPLSPYGASKVASEVIIKTFSKVYKNFKYTIIRPFNIYGPGQTSTYAGVVTNFCERLLRNLPPIIYGDGEQTRDFIYVEDVAEAITKIIECDKAVNNTYNVGTGIPTKINDLAKLVMEILGITYKPIYKPPRPGDIKHSYASIKRIRKDIGWEPKTSLKEGLKKTIEWFKENYLLY